MRISDWSSDVCSSDLDRAGSHHRSSGLEGRFDGEKADAVDLIDARRPEIGGAAEEDLRDLLAAELRPILLQESGRTGDRRCCEAVTADGDNVAILVDGIYAPGCNRQRPVGECAGNAIAGNR